MRLKPLLTAAAALVWSLSAWADATVTTTVDGVAESRELVKMTFDDATPEYVTLHFADNSTLVADISLVNVAIDGTGSGQTAIDAIIADPSLVPSGVYNLKGQRMGDTPSGLQPGVYIVNGQKIYVK